MKYLLWISLGIVAFDFLFLIFSVTRSSGNYNQAQERHEELKRINGEIRDENGRHGGNGEEHQEADKEE